MKKAASNLFDLVYGELIPLESKIFGRICFIFYDDNEKDPTPQIVYYPNSQELKTLRKKENEFSSFIPLYTEDFKEQMRQWMSQKFEKDILFKGIKYIDFLEELLV
jgi:hypothetical protein